MDFFWQELTGGMQTSEDAFRVILRLSAAVILGALIGLERQWEHKLTGMRTHILVALGSALFTVVASVDSTPDGISRAIQGVATGVGFLGAGTILKSETGKHVRGLTTAASIWLTAAVGMAVGAGWILPSAFTVFIAWVVLTRLPIHRDHNDSPTN